MVTRAHLGPGAQNCHLPSKQWLLCQHERWATEPRKLKHRTVRKIMGKQKVDEIILGLKLHFTICLGMKLKSRNVSAHKDHPHPRVSRVSLWGFHQSQGTPQFSVRVERGLGVPALRNPKCSTKPRPPAETISSEMRLERNPRTAWEWSS